MLFFPADISCERYQSLFYVVETVVSIQHAEERPFFLAAEVLPNLLKQPPLKFSCSAPNFAESRFQCICSVDLNFNIGHIRIKGQ